MLRLRHVVVVVLVACSRTPPQAASSPPPQAPAPRAEAAPAATAAPAPLPACVAARTATVFSTPERAWAGAPLHVLVTTEGPVDATLVVTDPGGREVARAPERHGGPPYWWLADVEAPAVGAYHAELVRAPCAAPPPQGAAPDDARVAKEIAVGDAPPPAPRPTWGTVWPVRAEWGRAMEDVYSAWIEKLFDAPLDEQPSWPALHAVLRDRSRNILADHQGPSTDEADLVIQPDCADLPYFLRAYFAFKLGLPFGYSECSRGEGGQPPSCSKWSNNFYADSARSTNLTKAFGHFLRYTLADAVHSGSGRVPAADDNTDYYPVRLDTESLRPGTIFADPYGHVLVVARRVAQTPEHAGMLLAVDGQPDGTVGRKRFWRGNFLFALDPALGSPGFKRFRPVVREKGGGLRRLSNAEVGADRDYGDFSMEQYGSGVEGFYDRMEDVLSPAPLDPMRAMKEVLDALEEQVKTRVLSVENGRKNQLKGGTVDMPDGPTIFETTGPWEDFSTPSRDLRLLIAIDVVRGFPERAERRPERYAMPAGKSPADVRADLEKVLAGELASRKFTYPRSDGTPWTLSLADVVARAPVLEMAYDPNDCVELRWGAAEGSDERATCKRRAPWAQQAKMRDVRSWFHERKRPARK
jgi:hypothetical protein